MGDRREEGQQKIFNGYIFFSSIFFDFSIRSKPPPIATVAVMLMMLCDVIDDR